MVEHKHDDSDKEKLREELAELRKTPINSSAIAEMSSGELMSLLAAFVVRYDKLMVQRYQQGCTEIY